MESVLTETIDQNTVPATIASQAAAHLTTKFEDKVDTEMREKFISRMIELPVKRGIVAAIARNLGAKPSTAVC
ncbi:hypothetical protein BY458DRAFT_559568 [Sporodiniella umbellata]|nr:hypothetical protein BY458DRAFT_559566 [Sporodiniella umbellata]KAI9251053.1 hypothetical protein BY458DRAFT_559568 [Sporodiniella umbellata]